MKSFNFVADIPMFIQRHPSVGSQAAIFSRSWTPNITWNHQFWVKSSFWWVKSTCCHVSQHFHPLPRPWWHQLRTWDGAFIEWRKFWWMFHGCRKKTSFEWIMEIVYMFHGCVTSDFLTWIGGSSWPFATHRTFKVDPAWRDVSEMDGLRQNSWCYHPKRL